MKISKAIPRDGFPSGREKATRRKGRKEEARLKVWPLSTSKKPRMCLPLVPVRVEERLLRTQLRRESDYGLLKIMYLGNNA